MRMLINVPQYIDVEDKIVGPLTAKQLGLFLIFGICLLILWNIVPAIVFFIIAIPALIFIIALAFYRPYGQSMGSFVIYGISYFFKPKIYVWKRAPQNIINVPQKAQTSEVKIPEKKLTAQSLSDLAKMLDSEGTEYNEGLENILKKEQVKKTQK